MSSYKVKSFTEHFRCKFPVKCVSNYLRQIQLFPQKNRSQNLISPAHGHATRKGYSREGILDAAESFLILSWIFISAMFCDCYLKFFVQNVSIRKASDIQTLPALPNQTDNFHLHNQLLLLTEGVSPKSYVEVLTPNVIIIWG